MDFDFTDDQQSLRDAVRRWVDKGFGFERRHKLAKAGGAARAVYSELAELGLAGLAIPEAHGGMGFGAIEAMVVCEELGRGLVNAPYAHAALVAPALLAAAPAALQSAWLPRVASAEALIVLAHQERAARYRLEQVSTRASRQGDSRRKRSAAGADCPGDLRVARRQATLLLRKLGRGLCGAPRNGAGLARPDWSC